MKKLLLAFIFINFTIASLKGQSQITYAYDAAGNRVERIIVLFTKSIRDTQKEPPSLFFEESLSERKIRFYPNPVKTILTVEVGALTEKFSGELMLFDQQGKLLVHQRINSPATAIDLEHYPSGNYVMRILVNGEKSTWKIIKE